MSAFSPALKNTIDMSVESPVSASLSNMAIDNQSTLADDFNAVDMDFDVDQSSVTAKKPFVLLDFPEEILIKILEHVVVLDKNIVVTQVCKGSNMVISSSAL